MPQPPFLTDAVQIEPGSGDTLLIERDSTDGAMSFQDAVITAGVLLPDLVGLRKITGFFNVGRAGDGAPYTTIQAALNAVPAASSAAAPSIVWIAPGLYTENLTIQKDGVYLFSPGGAKLINNGAADTITVSASLTKTPLLVVIRGLEIENDQAGQSCLNVVGADSFATGTATAVTAPLAAGDTLTIGGTALTGIAAARTSGSNDFSTLGGTVTAIAAEIAAAINDVANSFAATVFATPAAGVITIDAVTAGVGGNAITLAALTVPPGGITVSGLNLTGGGAAGSLVASDKVLLEDCTLVASGVGSLQVTGTTAGNIWVRNGSFRGSSSTSLCSVANCESFRVFGVEWVNNLGLSYDTGLDQPSVVTSAYEVKDCGVVGDTTCTLTGQGSLVVGNCSDVGFITQGGDRTLAVGHSGIGVLTLSGTTAAVLSHSSRGVAVVGAGTPTLSETVAVGTVAFAASAAETVTFGVPQPDAVYQVFLDSPTTAQVLATTARVAASFTVSAAGAITGTVGYEVRRDV